MSDSIEWEQEIPLKLHDLLRALCNNNLNAAANILWSIEEGKKAILNTVSQSITNEAAALCSIKPTSFRVNNVHELCDMSFAKQFAELQERAPVFSKMVTSAAYNERNLTRNTTKTKKSLIPSLVTAASLILNCRSQRIDAIQMYNSMILRQGAAKKSVFQRFNAVNLCLSHRVSLKHQLKMSTHSDTTVKQWKKEVEDAALQDELEHMEEEFLFDDPLGLDNSPSSPLQLSGTSSDTGDALQIETSEKKYLWMQMRKKDTTGNQLKRY